MRKLKNSERTRAWDNLSEACWEAVCPTKTGRDNSEVCCPPVHDSSQECQRQWRYGWIFFLLFQPLEIYKAFANFFVHIQSILSHSPFFLYFPMFVSVFPDFWWHGWWTRPCTSLADCRNVVCRKDDPFPHPQVLFLGLMFFAGLTSWDV